jgi:hypothetical protein
VGRQAQVTLWWPANELLVQAVSLHPSGGNLDLGARTAGEPLGALMLFFALAFCSGLVVAVAAGWAAGRHEERIIDEIEAEASQRRRVL